MRAQIICELASGHGGDMSIAEDMIRAAADSGADYAKIQSYTLAKLNPKDPQYDWLVQSHLNKAEHERLMRVCEQVGVKFLSTPFDVDALYALRRMGQLAFKAASTTCTAAWWFREHHETWFVSYPWGVVPRGDDKDALYRLTAIPLYPTQLECVTRATLLDGWSDHCQGIAACQWALAKGAKVIEAHLCLPGVSRQMPFDKTPQEFRQLREFAEACATMTTGVSETFRNRWSA